MLAELDVVVFLQSHDDLQRTAERVFGALHTSWSAATDEQVGDQYFAASGLGFSAGLYSNSDQRADPWFERYPYFIEITSRFWCVDLDSVDLEGPLSEYYGRMLAFGLDMESATAILVDTTEEGEWFEIVAYRRNPQYRLDQGPTTPKVVEIERRREFSSFEETEEWEEEDFETVAADEPEE
ncbi:MAG TPA: hypothetical protein VF898_09525 [Chloroflexota bacterium]